MDDDGNELDDDEFSDEEQPTSESEESEDDAILHEQNGTQRPRDNI